MGAWIEIIYRGKNLGTAIVAPFVGAWIEITLYPNAPATGASLPSWERGLKLLLLLHLHIWLEQSLPSWERGLK